MLRMSCFCFLGLFQVACSTDSLLLSSLEKENTELKQKVVVLERKIEKGEMWFIKFCKQITELASVEPVSVLGPLNTLISFKVFKLLESEPNEFKKRIYEEFSEKVKYSGRRGFDIPEPNEDNGYWNHKIMKIIYNKEK